MIPSSQPLGETELVDAVLQEYIEPCAWLTRDAVALADATRTLHPGVITTRLVQHRISGGN